MKEMGILFLTIVEMVLMDMPMCTKGLHKVELMEVLHLTPMPDASDDTYNEFYVTITGGTGVLGELRRITDYTGTSKPLVSVQVGLLHLESDTRHLALEFLLESYASGTGWTSSGGDNVGPCFNFDGSKQYITTGNINTDTKGLNITQGLTVCCWVKSDAENWSGNDCLISKKMDLY